MLHEGRGHSQRYGYIPQVLICWQVGFTLMYVKEQKDLRGAPSMPVPVTAIYLAVMVRPAQPHPPRLRVMHALLCFSMGACTWGVHACYHHRACRVGSLVRVMVHSR